LPWLNSALTFFSFLIFCASVSYVYVGLSVCLFLSVYCGIISKETDLKTRRMSTYYANRYMYIIIGYQLRWRFLSGSLPFYFISNYIATAYLLLANKISDLI